MLLRRAHYWKLILWNWRPFIWCTKAEYLAFSGMNLLWTWKSPPSHSCRPYMKLYVGGDTLSLATSGCSCHQAIHLSVTSWQGSGQFGTWRRQPGSLRKCWVEQVTTNTALSFWCLECCGWSVSMEGIMTHRRPSVERGGGSWVDPRNFGIKFGRFVNYNRGLCRSIWGLAFRI